MQITQIVKICKNVKSANLAHLLGPIIGLVDLRTLKVLHQRLFLQQSIKDNSLRCIKRGGWMKLENL